MSKSLYWADNYIARRSSALEALKKIKPGNRVFIGSACGEPQHLVKALSQEALKITGLEIVRMLSLETTSLTDIADRSEDVALNVRTIYLGSAKIESISRNMRFITPMNMSDVPSLFATRKLPINVALIQVSPPDDFGWMSLGISVDVTLAAARAADMVIAQVNSRMPRVLGQSFIHVNNVDWIVEHDEDLLAVKQAAFSKEADQIGRHIARLIDDGATLQIGLDAASQATVQALANKNDLGLHSQYLTEDVMHLYAQGVINNRRKGFNEGKLVASAAIGSPNLYEFAHNNPAVDFHPSDYVNDPFIISRHYRMVSMNVAQTIDLTGQVTAEASEQTFFAGVSGIPDFVRGARRSPGGKSILMLFSTSRDGQSSNIIPLLENTPVVVPRGDVHYIVTEYGVVNLFGKSLQERVLALIGIAHPNFRDQLFDAAKEAGMIGKRRTLGEAVHGVYPVHLEETIGHGEDEITIRPSKPVDERRIKEHYYGLDKEDVTLRFFHEKTYFGRSEVEPRSQIDYIKDLTLVAITGEFGFGRVVGVGEYLLQRDANLAEVAFSVNSDYRGKGLARILMKKLADAARENGISGLVAYTSPGNQAMIKLFHTLPYSIKTAYDSDGMKLLCRFDEPLND